MKAILDTRIMLAFHAVVVVGVILVSVVIYQNTIATHIQSVESLIEEQESVLTELALLTSRNEADGVVEGVINDCQARVEFETMLADLATLDRSKLRSTQQMFDACGSFYADRKALMLFRMEREVSILNQYIDQSKALSENERHDNRLANWNQLIELEGDRRDLLREQTVVQEKIISELIKGRSATHLDVQSQAQEGNRINELLGVLNLQIQTLHESLALTSYDS